MLLNKILVDSGPLTLLHEAHLNLHRKLFYINFIKNAMTLIMLKVLEIYLCLY